MLLHNACKNHKNMLDKLTNIVSKWSQNLSNLDPEGGLEATWEPPLKQDASKTSFLTILVPFWDALWDQFGVIFGITFFFKMFFLMWLFDGFGLHLGSQTTSKMRPKRGSKSRRENHQLCCYLKYMSRIRGCWKSCFVDVFFEPCFERALGAHDV